MVDNLSVDVIIKENYSYWETLMLSKHLGTATPITRLETHSSIFNIIEVSLYITPQNKHTIHYQPDRKSSVIDIILRNSSISNTLNVLGYETPSDHRSVLCTLKQSNMRAVIISNFDFKSTNWLIFQYYNENRISNHTVLQDFSTTYFYWP